jgi:hypothetical protein
LPTPGSPATATICPCPPCAFSSVWRSRTSLEPRAHSAGAHDLEDLDGLCQPAHGHGPEGPDLDIALGEAQRVLGHEGGARAGELLHPRGQVRGLADGGVVHVEVAVDRPHDHLARIETHADLHVDALRAPELVRVPADRLLHPERGMAGAHRVILVAHRGAEEGHDPVAHDLVDGALVAMHRFHHPLEHRIEKLARFLGVAVGQELHGALEIGEDHGDELALPLELGARREDLVREVLGRVGLRITETRGGGRPSRQGCAAGAAESAAAGGLGIARRAGRGQTRPALLAEPGPFASGSLTTRTRHGATSCKIGTTRTYGIRGV